MELDTEAIIIVSLLGLLLSYIILYYVIKSAIKDAYKELNDKNKQALIPERQMPAPKWTEAQLSLKSRYEKGEISFEEYTAEWNKIS